jgi:membrane-associated phospholipid phosphatase
MPEMSKASIQVSTDANAPEISCPLLYDLRGPQVEPEASYWLDCDIVNRCPVPRPITIDELNDKLSSLDPYPTTQVALRRELEELIMLARLRDEPAILGHEPASRREPQQTRLPLSLFLQLRPQPLGAVINTARGDAFPVVNTGRELARYFESETPGLQFRHALNHMIREEMWSPPRQAWVWAALDVTIYSALAAAWYIKWRGGPGVEFRPRPWECYPDLDVLFDRVTNSTNSADGPRRGFPPGVQPLPGGPPMQTGAPVPGTPQTPEAYVPDVPGLIVPPSQPTPGTPRHPAYPSGHSTYSAAAARLLIEFFPRYSEELSRLADNTGLARLWAGVHWRSDHTFGQKVGTAVAELVIDQLKATGIPRFPAPRQPDEAPPNPVIENCDPNTSWDTPSPADADSTMPSTP